MIGSDLAGPGITTSNALTALAGVLPAIEIVDSRIADWRIRLVDTVSDNASSGKLVIGGKLTKVTEFGLRLGGMVMTRNGAVIDPGAGAAALGLAPRTRGAGAVGWPDGSRAHAAGVGRERRVRSARCHRGFQLTIERGTVYGRI